MEMLLSTARALLAVEADWVSVSLEGRRIGGEGGGGCIFESTLYRDFL
jgi:hypothetical protein